jgi:glycosyltransferase involved in cell wall biosynthesis
MARPTQSPSRRISVLHITESSGGVQTFLSSILRYRDRRVFRHALMAPPDSQIFKEGAHTFDALYPLKMARTISPFRDVSAILKLAGFLRKNRFDIIHIHSSKAGLIGRMGAKLGGHRRVVFQPHGFSFLLFAGSTARRARKWERYAGRALTTVLVATSNSEATRAKEDAGIPATKVVVIPNGIDCDRLQAIADKKSENAETGFVLMVARLMRSKNPMMFARVAKLVAKQLPSTRFVLIGSGYHDEFQAPLTEYLRKNNLQKTLTVLPWMSYERTQDYVKRCMVYVSTSISECFGYGVVEAMFHEKPVVGTLIDGTRDIVLADASGLLVRPEDDHAMADCVIHLLESRMLREVYGVLGRKRVEEKFDARKNITLLENLWRRLVR